jgi:hypothetical protein
MSGAADYINDCLDDLDEGQTKVLSNDGEVNKLLDFMLMSLKDFPVLAC